MYWLCVLCGANMNWLWCSYEGFWRSYEGFGQATIDSDAATEDWKGETLVAATARTFLICNSSFNGDKFSEFILSHKLTKRAILIYLVPISSSIKPPCNQKMIFTSRFIRPMRNFVFLSITAMFREKFCAWYQTKGDDLVYHLGRAHAWVDTQSYKNDLIWFPYLVDALNRNAKIC